MHIPHSFCVQRVEHAYSSLFHGPSSTLSEKAGKSRPEVFLTDSGIGTKNAWVECVHNDYGVYQLTVFALSGNGKIWIRLRTSVGLLVMPESEADIAFDIKQLKEIKRMAKWRMWYEHAETDSDRWMHDRGDGAAVRGGLLRLKQNRGVYTGSMGDHLLQPPIQEM